MNVLILGGTGYLGSKLVRQFLLEGHRVVCTKRQSSNMHRLHDIADQVIWIAASVEGVHSVFQQMTIDYVLNVACNYGVGDTNFEDVLESNIVFPLKVLNAAVKCGASHFLTIGTGLPDSLNMYSFSKKVFSDFGKMYVDNYGIVFNNLLLEMFYGADEPENRFLSHIIHKMIKGEKVETTIGTQRRDIVAIEDIISAIDSIIKFDLLGYNEIPIGTGEAPSISEIVDFIWEETGKKSIICRGAISMRKNEPDCVADISVISSIMSWNPVRWKEGLKNMIRQIEEKCK